MNTLPGKETVLINGLVVESVAHRLLIELQVRRTGYVQGAEGDVGSKPFESYNSCGLHQANRLLISGWTHAKVER